VGLIKQIFISIFKIYAYIYVISELNSVEGQSNLPAHQQKESFWIKTYPHRRVFAWRHLEAGQYVAQSGLHLHQTKPHSYKESKNRTFVKNFEMQVYLPSH
jgi:hypothetical protein